MVLRPDQQREFDTLRTQALDLLEWGLQDLAPEGHRFTIRCGIEREMHYLHEGGVLRLIVPIARMLREKFPETLEKFYKEICAPSLVELVTRPLGLRAAVDAVKGMTEAVKQYAQEHGDPCDMVLDLTDEMFRKLKTMGPSPYHVYPAGAHSALQLVGRGQHANLSLWYDDRPLFGSRSTLAEFGKGCVPLLPAMTMQLRKGNYQRIKIDAALSIQHYHASSGGKEAKNALRIVQQSSAYGGIEEVTVDQARLEFRQAAAEADPEDVALAAALPLVKLCRENLKRDASGKLVIASQGLPEIEKSPSLPPGEKKKIARSHEEAVAFFREHFGVYAELLDQLAREKLKRAQTASRGGEEGAKTAVHDAQELQDIGTRLQGLYELAYDLPTKSKTVRELRS